MKYFNKVSLSLLFALVCVMPFSVSADVYHNFTKTMGGTALDYGNTMIRDSGGNIYITGGFNGTADFDPGAGVSNLTSNGSTDIFITKLNSSGDLVWAKSIGNANSQDVGSVAVDSTGNVYVVGGFYNTIDFDPGAGTSELTALSSTAGARDIFILKLNSSGEFVSVKQIGGAGNNAQGWVGDDWATKIIIDSSDNMFIVGSFGYTVDFDPGAGTANLSVSGGSGADIFMLKLDSAGDYVWAKSMGCVDWGDYANGVVLDASGNIYLTGIFGGSLAGRSADFDPDPVATAILTNQGTLDIYVAKYDSTGAYIWAKDIGAVGTGQWRGGSGISLDSSGNLYTVGGFNGAVDFDPGAGTTTLTSAGSYDAYLLKLNSSGVFVSVKQFGSTGDDYFNKLNFDSSDNIYLIGEFQESVDFDPGAGTTTLTSAGNTDTYLLKLDSSADFVYIKQFGGIGYDALRGISIDSTGDNIFMAGTFNNTVDFDPSPNTYNVTSVGDADIVLMKLGPDTTAPTFTSVSSSNITNTGVTITWTTNEVSSSIVDYGTTSNYGSTTTETDTSTHVASHTVNLSNLTECTTYHYRVKSNDPSANLGTSSDSTFTTPGCSAVSVVLLQQMSDAMRAQENNTVVLPPTTPTNTIVLCEQGQLFNPNTGQKCTSSSNENNQNNNTTSKFIFLKNLKYKDNNTDVKELQKFLNSHNFIISTTGAGSPGNETNYFGLATRNALIKFQLDNDIKPAVGYFGPTTRGVVNNK